MKKIITDNGHYTCKAGDELEIRDNSAPVITQSGGWIGTYDNSAPVIKRE